MCCSGWRSEKLIQDAVLFALVGGHRTMPRWHKSFPSYVSVAMEYGCGVCQVMLLQPKRRGLHENVVFMLSHAAVV